MGRLFWKFLLGYWFALLGVVVGIVAASWLYYLSAGGSGDGVDSGPRAAFALDGAVATARHGGIPALRDLLAESGRFPGAPIVAVDARGSELLGRAVPGRALARARALVDAGGSAIAARRVTTPDGSYTLFVPSDTSPLVERMLFPGGPPPPWAPLAAGTVASLAFGAALAWYVARPIRHLREAFTSLSEGHLDTRVAARMGSRKDELADLGRRFDEMAERLQKLMGAQRALLHDVSHELRSPLARLEAAVGLARQNPRKLESSLARIEEDAERLDELVGQLLTLSRLESQSASAGEARREKTDLVELVASVADDARFEAESTGRTLVFTSRGGAVADVQPELLHRAFENVVRNAVRFAPPATAVEVAAEADASGAFVVRVSDHGPGVPESELGQVFEPFFRGAAAAGAAAGSGFGLGLAITRRAIEAHGGRVSARNRPGGGLEIEIRLEMR